MYSVKAWCATNGYENKLSDHLYNTLRAVLISEKLRSALKVASLKISLPFEEKLRGTVAEIATALSLYSVVTHDLGKACSGFQDTVKVSNNKCIASFHLHEIISGAIVYEFINNEAYLEVIEVLDSSGKNDRFPSYEEALLKGLLFSAIYSVVSHHQAMEGRGLKSIERRPEDLANEILENRCGRLLVDELSHELEELRLKIELLIDDEKDRLFRAALNRLSSWIKKTTSTVKSFEDRKKLRESLAKTLGCLRGYGCTINPLSNGIPFPLQHAYITTGILMVADNLAATCERGSSGGFGERLWIEIGDYKDLKDLCLMLGVETPRRS